MNPRTHKRTNARTHERTNARTHELAALKNTRVFKPLVVLAGTDAGMADDEEQSCCEIEALRASAAGAGAASNAAADDEADGNQRSENDALNEYNEYLYAQNAELEADMRKLMEDTVAEMKTQKEMHRKELRRAVSISAATTKELEAAHKKYNELQMERDELHRNYKHMQDISKLKSNAVNEADLNAKQARVDAFWTRMASRLRHRAETRKLLAELKGAFADRTIAVQLTKAALFEAEHLRAKLQEQREVAVKIQTVQAVNASLDIHLNAWRACVATTKAITEAEKAKDDAMDKAVTARTSRIQELEGMLSVFQECISTELLAAIRGTVQADREKAKECSMCFHSDKPQAALVPCGHCLCIVCAATVQFCPDCAVQVQSTQVLYRG